MQKYKILIFGAGGMLGHKLCQLLPKMGYEVIATHRSEKVQNQEIYTEVTNIPSINVLDPIALERVFKLTKPDFVINCIGIVKQLDAAHNRYLSVAINAYLPHQLNNLCEKYYTRMIHISTDCVFSGNKGMYTESDPSDANDLYGKSKFLGETDANQIRALTLRTSIIGHELKSNTHGLLAWFLKQRNSTVNGFKNAFFSGFTTNEIANVIHHIITKHPTLSGMYHLASNRISKFDLLTLINDEYNLNITINPESDFHCDRSLDMSKFIEATGYQAPLWSSMIHQMHTEQGNRT